MLMYNCSPAFITGLLSRAGIYGEIKDQTSCSVENQIEPVGYKIRRQVWKEKFADQGNQYRGHDYLERCQVIRGTSSEQYSAFNDQERQKNRCNQEVVKVIVCEGN